MFVNKVQDQRWELLRAVFRNMYLKEKCDYLDNECKMLAEHVLTSQVTKANSDETNKKLQMELENLKKIHNENVNKLLVANEKIISMTSLIEKSVELQKSTVFNSLNECESMNETLDVKNDMIRCLQEELIQARLEAAEKWALIRELKQTKNELERDKEMLLKKQPETIARLQEELIGAKLRETQYSLEFESIKKQLHKMKAELDVHKNESLKNDLLKPEPKIKLFKKGVLWQTEDKNEDKEIIINEIKRLELEKLQLQNRIPDLRNKLEILEKHIQFKEDVKRKLHSQLNEIKLSHQNIEKIIAERKRQYEHLENSASDKVIHIRNSCEEKKQDMDELSNKLDQVSQRRLSCMSSCSDMEYNIIQTLEENIVFLEDRIKQLKN